MRLLCAAALSLTFGLWLAFSNATKPVAATPSPTPDEKTDRAAKLEARKKKFEATFKELSEQFEKAEGAEKTTISRDIKEETMLMVEKVLAIAEENPKDEVALDAVTYLLEKASDVGATGMDFEKSLEKAVGILVEHHIASAKVKESLIPAMYLGPPGEKLLKVVSEKTTDKDTKALALFIRGYQMSQNIQSPDFDDEDEKLLNAQVKDATELLEQAAKLSPTTKLGSKPNSPIIGDLAPAEIKAMADFQKAITGLAVGKPAPPISSKLLDGKDVKLEDYKGKVVLLDIWATWCPPCRAMIPHERELVEKMKDKPFVLVSVSADKDKKTLQEFLEKEKMPWVHWWNDGPKSEVLTKYRVKAFPTLYIIDHTGTIKHKWIGNPGNDKIDAAIEELVKAAIKAKG
jgi:thiol-disulfide isomerase/thioredoxin